MSSLIVSKKRVEAHGEVFTPAWLVRAMLDLVEQETARIDSRFLEPACGTGNFLVEILRRKLAVVKRRYRKCRQDYERYAFLAASSLYGIDILQDNVSACRENLQRLLAAQYTSLYGHKSDEGFLRATRFVLERNILWGDALTLQTPDKEPQPIIFSEWALVRGGMVKRRDFIFAHLLSHASLGETPLFSDVGEEVYIPKPVKEYPLTHFLKLPDAEKNA